MKHRYFTAAFKVQLAEEYLAGARLSVLLRQHDLDKKVFHRWKEKYLATGAISDDQGKTNKGRPKKAGSTPHDTRCEYSISGNGERGEQVDAVA